MASGSSSLRSTTPLTGGHPPINGLGMPMKIA